MALDQSALPEFVEMLKTSDDGELMRKMLTTMLQALMEAEASAFIGAAPHERTDPAHSVQRQPGQARHDRDGGSERADPEGADRLVLLCAAGYGPADRRRLACGGDAGLRRGCEHPSSR